VENQPSQSLISLSPLTTNHSRALLRPQMRPICLFMVRSLGFGCTSMTNIIVHKSNLLFHYTKGTRLQCSFYTAVNLWLQIPAILYYFNLRQLF